MSIEPSDIRKEEDSRAFWARAEWGETDEQGRLEPRLAPGAYRITADVARRTGTTVEATLEEGKTTEVTLRP